MKKKLLYVTTGPSNSSTGPSKEYIDSIYGVDKEIKISRNGREMYKKLRNRIITIGGHHFIRVKYVNAYIRYHEKNMKRRLKKIIEKVTTTYTV